MWACNQCIMLVSRDNNLPTGISGFGFNSPNAPDGSTHCNTTGMNKLVNKNGHEILTYPIESFKDNIYRTITCPKKAFVEATPISGPA